MTIVTRSPTTAANYNNPGAPGRDTWLAAPTTANIFANQPAGLSVDLVFSGFDLASAIPAGATINGIQVGCIASSDLTTASDARVVLRIGTGTDSTNKAKAGTWPLSPDARIYGSTAGDTWGLAVAYPGLTLSEIVRSANFSLAIQINNAVGDPEDFFRSYLSGVSLAVDWSLPVTIKSMTAAAVITMTGEARIGILTNLTMAGGAHLAGVGHMGRRVDLVADGSASLTAIAVASIAVLSATPPWRTITLFEIGNLSLVLTDAGATQVEVS